MYGTVVVVMILQVCWNFKMVDDPKQYCGWSKIKVVMITASHMIHCDFNAMSTWGVRGARFSRIKRPERSWPILRKLLSLNSKLPFFMSKNNFTSHCPSPRLLSAYGDIVTRSQQRWIRSFTYFVSITILTRGSNQGDDPKKHCHFHIFVSVTTFMCVNKMVIPSYCNILITIRHSKFQWWIFQNKNSQLYLGSFLCYLTGFILWNLDNHTCPTLQYIRAALPTFLRPFIQVLLFYISDLFYSHPFTGCCFQIFLPIFSDKMKNDMPTGDAFWK